jgi:hypothetical protein
MSTGFSSAAIPNAPTIGTATATSDVAATVTYTAAVLGATGTTFTATSNPSSITGTGSSPITVTGLTASTSYTFTVTAGNANGTSAASSASNSITTSAPLSSYESIATATVGSGGQSTVEFNSIPSTFKHLQVRVIARDNRVPPSGNFNNMHLQVGNGSIDTGSNYTYHTIRGDGSSASTDGAGNSTVTDYTVIPSSTAGSNTFGAQIWDILDYANTNKYKTIRMLSGTDNNGTGLIEFSSSVWRSTSAITNLRFLLSSTPSFVQYTQFALYGIKGA